MPSLSCQSRVRYKAASGRNIGGGDMVARRILVVLVGVVVAGCAGLEVSDGSKKLDGLPFYVKVPVATQDTLRATSDLNVQLTISEVVEVEGKSKVIRSQSVLASGPLRIADSVQNRVTIDQVVAAIPDTRTSTFESTVSAANDQVTRRLVPLGSGPVTETTCSARQTDLVSNSWAIAMVADPKPHFITTKIPVMGSGTSTFKFSADGTLTDATSTVSDDTTKNLLGLFPITAKLTKQWGLAPESAAKAAADAELAFKLYKFDGPPTAIKPPATTNVTKSINVEVTVAAVKTVYALRKAQSLGGDADLNSYLTLKAKSAPLQLCQAFNGTDGVQLVSISTPGEQSGGKKADGESKAWQLQGSVTPPKADGVEK
jgi:hypothetical protein